ncbi:hypothetical protein L9H26_18935 [Morganella psychrotolerans]|uniref:Uncharacterized protein n=1 Tax=Morganella psychrotolerans TaxID=368603 RepID=A0A5M9QX66_9GAMM|nr:hypothetical protein [Morganella psychrotolerans]KAA8712978.1 hypothetical protein F4V73_17835 [Morganella psychrotolerans]OBU01920.1 hypothetical protein AYY16_17075 [Morganella psychrotolerans]
MFSKLFNFFFGKNTSRSNQTAKNDRRLSSGLYGGNNRFRASSNSQGTSSRSHHIDPLSDDYIIHTTSTSSTSSTSPRSFSCDSSYSDSDSSSYSGGDSGSSSCD